MGTSSLRQWLLLAAAVLLALAVARLAAPRLLPPPAEVTRPTPTATTPPRYLPWPTGGLRLLVGSPGRLDLADLDASTMSRLDRGGGLDGVDRPFVRAGSRIVALRRGAAWLLADRLDRPPTRLGAADHAFASATPGRVWLVRARNGPARQRFHAQEVDEQGRPTGQAAVLPSGSQPLAATGQGLVTGSARHPPALDRAQPGPLELVRPGAPGSRRFAARALLVDVDGSRLAWLEDGDGLWLEDLALGRGPVRVRVPERAGEVLPGGAFAPDGRLAVTVSGNLLSPKVVVVGPDGAGAAELPGTESSWGCIFLSCLDWDPSGRFLFFPSQVGPVGVADTRQGSGAPVRIPELSDRLLAQPDFEPAFAAVPP